MTLTLLPSAEQVVVAWAKANTDLTAITGGRVGTKLGATLPAIRVTRIGGVPEHEWQDDPSLQMECWAADQAAADTLVRTLIAVLPTIRNLSVAGGRVYTFVLESGPYWAPDDPSLSTYARYILGVRLLVTA